MAEARGSESWLTDARRDWGRMSDFLAADDGGGAGMLLAQSLEKYLKGWLVKRGWTPRPTHDLGELVDAADEHDPTLLAFRPLCERISRYYAAETDPDIGAAGPTADEVRLDVGEATLLVHALYPDEELQ